MDTAYRPPFTSTARVVAEVAKIAELVGRLASSSRGDSSPRLTRGDRIRTVHASLAIENNTLSLEQVTAVLDGRNVLGSPREIREVRNTFGAYERVSEWDPRSADDLLAAHRALMEGLVDDPGAFRRSGVGIARGPRIVHVAPPADRVPFLVGELLGWLRTTDAHPLVAGAVVHYELEFIHPFSDGNGRLGRLWQTVILARWRSAFAFLPVETVIRDRREEYYRALAVADDSGDAASFVEFILCALRDAIEEVAATDQVSDQVSDQVARLLRLLGKREMGSAELMRSLRLSHRPTFRKNGLAPALANGWIEPTQPDSPRSPTQRYRLTDAGRRLLSEIIRAKR
jgi:Fic family protein